MGETTKRPSDWTLGEVQEECVESSACGDCYWYGREVGRCRLGDGPLEWRLGGGEAVNELEQREYDAIKAEIKERIAQAKELEKENIYLQALVEAQAHIIELLFNKREER